jgi:hypothetical protein
MFHIRKIRFDVDGLGINDFNRNTDTLLQLRYCCRSKPTGEQRQATRGAGRLPGLLVDPGPWINGPEVRHTLWLEKVLGVPPDLYLIRKV